LRDATARAIYLENKYGRGGPNGGAYIAVNHLPENIIDEWIREYSPAFLSRWKKIGIDIRRHAVEAGPGSHYTMGGVRVNENCETTVPRLFAAGEVAAGMDGAERIDGGPAITWCLTMGCVAGREASGAARDLAWPEIDYDQVEKEKKKIDALFDRETGVRGCEVKNKIKDIMWEYCAPGCASPIPRQSTTKISWRPWRRPVWPSWPNCPSGRPSCARSLEGRITGRIFRREVIKSG